jgi:hypothetical protein
MPPTLLANGLETKPKLHQTILLLTYLGPNQFHPLAIPFSKATQPIYFFPLKQTKSIVSTQNLQTDFNILLSMWGSYINLAIPVYTE